MKASIFIASIALLMAIAITDGLDPSSLGPVEMKKVTTPLDTSNLVPVKMEKITPQLDTSNLGIVEMGSHVGLGGGEETGDVEEGVGQGQPEEVSDLEPSTLIYIGESTITLGSYMNALGKYLWIEGNNGLSQYASASQHSDLSLIAYTSTGGQGEFLEIYPSLTNQGTYQRTYYYFKAGYNRIPYRADISGRHHLIFSMNDLSSNAIIIDVKDAGPSVVLGTAPSNFNAQGVSDEGITNSEMGIRPLCLGGLMFVSLE